MSYSSDYDAHLDAYGDPGPYSEPEDIGYECSRCHRPAMINPRTGNAEHVEPADAVACAIFNGSFQ